MRRALVGIMQAFLLLSFAGLSGAEGGPSAPSARRSVEDFSVIHVEESRRAPDFTLENIEGGTTGIAEFKGSVVLVHFWASWCEPCKKEFPAFKAIAEEFGPKGFVVLAVAGDSLGNARRFAGQFDVNFPVLVDRYGGVMRDYGVKAFPSSIVVGRDGLVKGVIIGARDYTSPGAMAYFERLLNEGR